MPFIDTERLYGLNKFYNNNKNIIRKIDIITLKENKEKIEEILTNKTNIVEMDEWLGGIDGERQEKVKYLYFFFLLSYIVLIPLINGFMKILEKCFNTNLNTIDINFLNLFTVIFRNGTIFIIWVILNLIIILVAKI